MNIGEVEKRTGLTRANIRYYEKENLLSTTRSPNGYRDYTEENVESLLRIRLMRELGIPLDEIRRLQPREEELNTVVEKRIKQIQKESQKLKDSEMVCQNIYENRVSYEELDAAYYLKELSVGKRESRQEEIIRQDVIPEKIHPFRRYFARATDEFLYSLLTLFIWTGVFRIRTLEGFMAALWLSVSGVIFTLILEPLFLSRFATTPGKWIFGIRIRNTEGGLLSYEEAKARTRTVILWGCGLYIPAFRHYCNIKSYINYTRKGSKADLQWEDKSICTFVDDSMWRYGACLAVWLLTLYLSVACIMGMFLPRHQGDITPEQFVENYNDYADLGSGSAYCLAMSGTEDNESKESKRFVWKKTDLNAFIIEMHPAPRPEFTYTEKDGVLQSISFEVDFEVTELVGGYHSYMTDAVQAFVCAQKTYHPFNFKLLKMKDYMEENALRDFQFTDGDITVQCKIRTSGLTAVPNLGFRPENEEEPGRLLVSFSMERN